MNAFIEERLLEKIKKRLKLILPDFIFNTILKIFRKFKLGLKLIVPQLILNKVYLIRYRIICEYTNFKYRNCSDKELAELYNQRYHQVYINNPDEIELKKWQAIAIKRAIPEINKALIAGCSGGELVRALRNIGIETYGFDISPDLDKIVIDEVRSYIRKGSILDIPFSVDDGFDAFIAIDVFEHVPINRVDKMIKEIVKINAKYMVTIINYSEYGHVGHITMKPLSWWKNKFKKYYKIDESIDFSREGIPVLYSLDNNRDHQLIFWRRT